MLITLVHGMISKMRGGGISCKELEAKSMQNAKDMEVQNTNSVKRQSIKGPKYSDVTFS